MAKKKKCPECPAGEKWAVPYADFLSLLLALFIALYAISATNTEKVKALKTEFIKIFDYSPKPDEAQPVIPLNPAMQESLEELESQQEENKNTQSQNHQLTLETLSQGGALDQVEGGIVLKLPTNLLFPPNAAKLEDQDSQLFFKRIAQIIQKLPPSVKVDVRGFAENPNPQNTSLQNDYELASARALYVMQALIKNGISPQKLFFSSQGKYGQKIDARDEQDRIAKNNRVEIYFLVNEQQSQKVKKILTEISSQ